MNKPSSQQPQNTISLPRNNNSLDEIDQGCFDCYKIALYVYIAFGIVNIGNMIRLLVKNSTLAGYYISAMIMQAFLLFYIAIQLQALKQKDLGKAKLALIGFVIYTIVSPTLSICFSIGLLGYVDNAVAAEVAISLLSFIFFVLVGSIKVYIVLKENPSLNDGSHMNEQSSQQPQNTIFLTQNINLDEIDQGCFDCYKIALYVYIVFGIVNIGNMIRLLAKDSSIGGYYISAMIMQAFLLFYIAIQLKAIKQKDLAAAKLALIGFVIYMIVCPTLSISFSIGILGYVDNAVAVEVAISLVSFIFFVLIGSIKVYIVLKENQSQSDGYQNLDNVTRNNTTV